MKCQLLSCYTFFPFNADNIILRKINIVVKVRVKFGQNKVILQSMTDMSKHYKHNNREQAGPFRIYFIYEVPKDMISSLSTKKLCLSIFEMTFFIFVDAICGLARQSYIEDQVSCF